MSKKGSEGPGVNKKKRDKTTKRHKDSRTGFISGRGPVGLIVAKIIDTFIMVVRKVFEFLWFGLTIPTFNFTWNLLFSEFHGVFAGKNKDGDCYNSSFFRYIITILLPPMGVFMSKGVSGWPSITICAVLTLFHIFPGIIYAFIVTYHNRYSDRYQQREMDRIEEAKKRRAVDPNNNYGMLSIVIGVLIIIGIVFGFIKIAQYLGGRTRKN
jgi:uncharacterized membrane protein YqaE (UPF0057 family)